MAIFTDTTPFYGQDPFVLREKGRYLLIESQDESRITLRPFNQTSQPTVIYDNPGEFQVWAPEIHKIKNKFYVYYSASDGCNKNHRPYVLKSVDDNPFSQYFRYGPLLNEWAIDMTTFQYNGKRYAVWSGWTAPCKEFPQNLYIAEMPKPTKIGTPYLLAYATENWEQSHQPILEGPQAYQSKDGFLRIFYAANASWTQDYATGVLTLTGTEPLNAFHWQKSPSPIFTNAGHGHPIPGTHLFVTHRKLSGVHGWQDREITYLPLPPYLQ